MNDDLQLTDWLFNFIESIRKDEKLLSYEVDPYTKQKFDFSQPLQIEVFWLQDPSIQFLIFTHDATRKDLDIHIHGPSLYDEFISNLVNVLNEKRFTKKVSSHETQIELNKIIANEVHYGLNRIIKHVNQNDSLSKWFTENLFTESYNVFDKNNWITTFHGNISKLRIDELITKLKTYVAALPVEGLSFENIAKKTGVLQCYSSHIFPPVQIGIKKEPSITEILNGQNPERDIVFSKTINNIPILVHNDGLIAIGINDESRVIQLFNAIMGNLILQDQNVRIARVSDLYETLFDTSKMKITGLGFNPVFTIRGSLISYENELQLYSKIRKEIDVSIIEKSIQTVLNTSEDTIIEDLVFLAESYSHLEESVYAQSFVISWLIIERYLYGLWKNWWSDKLSKGQKIPNLQADRLLQFLKAAGMISEIDYGFFSLLRDIRNGYVHSGNEIQKDSAKKCFENAKSVVNLKLLK